MLCLCPHQGSRVSGEPSAALGQEGRGSPGGIGETGPRRTARTSSPPSMPAAAARMVGSRFGGRWRGNPPGSVEAPITIFKDDSPRKKQSSPPKKLKPKLLPGTVVDAMDRTWPDRNDQGGARCRSFFNVGNDAVQYDVKYIRTRRGKGGRRSMPSLSRARLAGEEPAGRGMALAAEASVRRPKEGQAPGRGGKWRRRRR